MERSLNGHLGCERVSDTDLNRGGEMDGWSSCCPDRTSQLLELPCARLSVGDVCISLALRNLRNGSAEEEGPAPGAPDQRHLRRWRHRPPPAAAVVPATDTSSPPGAPPRTGSGRTGTLGIVGDVGVVVGGGGGGGAAIKAENGTELSPPGGASGGGRAPEGRKVDKMEEEAVLPAALPRASFLPHDLKVSIEGRSSFGEVRGESSGNVPKRRILETCRKI
ncbi:hypothetical protein CRUP_008985 [Coryphaenoides rupestris]|nr:hypothetical protein CRUP_008985 [Coryphaenoides rupestris]